jgi:hypothetical protein
MGLRSFLAIVSVGLAVGCGAVPGGTDSPDAPVVTGAAAIATSAPKSLFAGTTMQVACSLLDAGGKPVAWPSGAAATITVGDQQVLQSVSGPTFRGHKAGSTTVTCSYGGLKSSVTTLVLPGSPVTVTTGVASSNVVAGAVTMVTCKATDSEGNDASGAEVPTVSLGNPAGGTVQGVSVTLTQAGPQTLSCAFGSVKGAATNLTVAAARPASLSLAIAPVQASYRPGAAVTATVAVLDAYGNAADRSHLVVKSSPAASSSPGALQFLYNVVGRYVISASIDGAYTAGGAALAKSANVLVNDGGPAIRCDTPSQLVVPSFPATVSARGHVADASGLASVTVDGHGVAVDPGSNQAVDFSASATAAAFGVNVFTVVATDLDGATTTRHCAYVAAPRFLRKDDPQVAQSPGVGLALGPNAVDDQDRSQPLVSSLGDVLAKVSLATMRSILDDYLTANPFVAHACVSVICDDAYYVPHSLSLGTVALGLALVPSGLQVNLDATDFSAGVTTQLLGSSNISVATLSASAVFAIGAANGVFTATLADDSIQANYSEPHFDNILFQIGAAIFPSLVTSVVDQVLHNLIGPVVNLILQEITVDRLGVGVTLRRLDTNADQTTTLGGQILQAGANQARLFGAIAARFSTTGGTPLPYKDLSLGAAVPGGTVSPLDPPLAGRDVATSIHGFTVNQILHELWENSFFELATLDADALAYYGIALDGLDQLLSQFTISLSAPVPAVAEVRPGGVVRIGAAGLHISLSAALLDVPIELEVSGVFDIAVDIEGGRLHVVSVTPVGPLPGANLAITVLARPSTLSDGIVDALVSVATDLIHTLTSEVLAQTLVGIPVPSIHLPARLGSIVLPAPVTLDLVNPTASTEGAYLVARGGLLEAN